MTVKHLLQFFPVCRNLRDIQIELICKLHNTTKPVTSHCIMSCLSILYISTTASQYLTRTEYPEILATQKIKGDFPRLLNKICCSGNRTFQNSICSMTSLVVHRGVIWIDIQPQYLANYDR